MINMENSNDVQNHHVGNEVLADVISLLPLQKEIDEQIRDKIYRLLNQNKEDKRKYKPQLTNHATNTRISTSW